MCGWIGGKNCAVRIHHNHAICKIIHDIHKLGNTVIIVTHEEDIARHAHRIIRLRDGEVASDEVNKNLITMADYHLAEKV